MYKGTGLKRDVNPKDKAGIISMLAFFFTVPVFKKSAKRELIEEDVYKVLKACESKRLGDALEFEWKKELSKNHPSLTKTMFRVFGARYMLFGFANLLMKMKHILVKPWATGKLVSFFAPNSNLTVEDAYFYAAILIASTVMDNFFRHTYHLGISEIGLRIKIALCSLMYRKSLKLSTSALIEVTNGKIVTLMSKDVQVFESTLSFGHDLWIGIIQLAVMGYMMYRHIKVSAFIGISFMVLLIPIQVWIGIKTKNMRVKTAAKTDERLRRIQEILTSMKLIKLYTWERFYNKITNELRATEMKKLRSIFFLKAILLTVSALSQRISFFLCVFSYFCLFGQPLTSEVIFVIITIYGSLFFVLSIAVPMSISQFAEAKTAIKRIKQYLLIGDISEDKGCIVKGVRITASDARVELLGKKILRGVNFECGEGLVGVTGSVGAGKSTFLKMLMGDVLVKAGSVRTNGVLSYASQEPWLFPSTIKDNILFGLPYEEERYTTVVKVCGLTRDLENFPLKDNTIVNDKGLNLSKGQQARINLARAVYKRSDIYLLDDAMSALDAGVSKYVFEECVRGFLKNKICILVCHNQQFLEVTDRIIVFDGGVIKEDGHYNELLKKGVQFGKNANIDSQIPTAENPNLTERLPNEKPDANEDCELLATRKDDSAAIYGEGKQSGNVTWSVYKKYFTFAGGAVLISSLLLLSLVGQLSIGYFDYFTRKWLFMGEVITSIQTNITNSPNNTELQKKFETANDDYFGAMYTYCVIIIISTILTTARFFYFFTLTTRASTKLHESVFTRITGACMSFFDRHLSGNILNRFSKDIGSIDEYLPYVYFECMRVFFVFGVVCVIIMYINPVLAYPTLCLLMIMLVARKHFLTTSRSLKRLDGTTRAPVIGFLNSSLEGLTTIRASGNQQILKDQFDGHQDLNSSVNYMFISTSRAFGLWLDILSTCYITIVILSFVLSHKKDIFSGDVGIAVTQAFGLTGMLQWGIRQWTSVENEMTAVERVLEYHTAEQEHREGGDPDNWPRKGRIEYRNVNLRYTNSDKKVLNNINFIIEPKQKIGIIGRTGAGKSSIISVLFRLYAIEGSIVIDDVDIKDIELDTVRGKISIIPQDPVLFAGTIRTNLDPNGEHTDLQLWNALGEVELKGMVEGFELGLSSVVNEGGANFSVGQRQLICLARAVLRNNRILVLDEATANIDPQTDALIQLTIKRLFSECTILTVAHRLNTVINSDKIMVVDFGTVLEFDAPETLLRKQRGIFYSMAKQAGLVN